jgi:four helix bundle protein
MWNEEVMDNGQSSANVLKDKSYGFALRSVKLYKFLVSEHKEYVLSKQLLRSGTSIGANVAEANEAQSKADFVHKLAIPLKEATETQYWIELLRDSEFLPIGHATSMIDDCRELQRILTASIRTSKGRSV